MEFLAALEKVLDMIVKRYILNSALIEKLLFDN
jgi:hypothetical protein